MANDVIEITGQSNAVGKTCPFCQSPLKSGADVVRCTQCSIPHHQECWEANGGCTTYGCRGLPENSGAAVTGSRRRPVKSDVRFTDEGRASLGNGIVIFSVILFVLWALLQLLGGNT